MNFTEFQYNPFELDHGGPDAAVRHVGDLGNVVADADGNAILDVTDAQIQLNGDYSVIGRAVMIHAVLHSGMLHKRLLFLQTLIWPISNFR